MTRVKAIRVSLKNNNQKNTSWSTIFVIKTIITFWFVLDCVSIMCQAIYIHHSYRLPVR